MAQRSFLLCFLLLIVLVPLVVLGAEDADAPLPDSFENLARELLRSLEKVESGSVLAVLDIRNTDGRDSALGNYLEESLADLLLGNTDLPVVERNQLDQVLQEWEYNLSGMVSEDSVQTIGNMTGADAVLVGILTRVDQTIQVNLRIIDTESAMVLASAGGRLTEPRYLSMYLDVFDSEILTEEDFFLGQGRDFDRDRAFLDAFFNCCRAIEQDTGTRQFLDKSFLEYIEAAGSVEFTTGSRENCTLRVRKDQFQPQHLYNYFFRDGRSQTVWYYDEKSYGWHTNPLFQALVESEHDTFGVPEVYREAVKRNTVFSSAADFLESPSLSLDNTEIRAWGSAKIPEWALLNALLDVAIMLETRMEMVAFRDGDSAVDFVTEYVPLENLEWVFQNLIGREVQKAGDDYIVRVNVDLTTF
jgi:TolB-like protein